MKHPLSRLRRLPPLLREGNAEVEAQQKEILKTVRRLAEEGQIVLGGGADDSFV